MPERSAIVKVMSKKNPHAVALGKLGGKKGGPARMAKLTSAERTALGKRGAFARWGKEAAAE